VLKVAIVGCGKIADDHAAQIARMPNAELGGFCDAEILMAQQMHERFNRAPYFDDLDELLAKVRPDVVHITTPPESHFGVARRCLAANCHVYVEKPFTIDAREAEALVRTAKDHGCKLTVGHNYLFTAPTIRMRALIKEGYLGGAPVHMESYYGYNLGDAAYARAFLGDRHHWVRRLPGRLLHNLISHGVCRIAEHIQSDSPLVIALGFGSSVLDGLGETDIQDELRVVIRDEFTTAYFTFSTQMRPLLSLFRIYGPKNGLVIDDHHDTLVKLRGGKYKSYLENIVPSITLATQHFRNALSNTRRLLNHDLNMNGALRTLIREFYRSIEAGTPAPIPYREILLTAKIMDAIFGQIGAAGRRRVDAAVASSRTPIAASESV
jgi:predicted dehydrogenase